MTSYAPQVTTNESDQWIGNALRFATREEAEASVRGLSARWTSVRDVRVVETADPVNYTWQAGELVKVEQDAQNQT